MGVVKVRELPYVLKAVGDFLRFLVAYVGRI